MKTAITFTSPIMNRPGDIWLERGDDRELVGRVDLQDGVWVATDGSTTRKFKSHLRACDWLVLNATV